MGWAKFLGNFFTNSSGHRVCSRHFFPNYFSKKATGGGDDQLLELAAGITWTKLPGGKFMKLHLAKICFLGRFFKIIKFSQRNLNKKISKS
jgi:hypothetical protein